MKALLRLLVLTLLSTTLITAAMAQPSAPDERDALIIASYSGMTDMVNNLLQTNRVDINRQQENGFTALMFAAQNGHAQIVRTLLQAGCETDLRQNDGFTALMLASVSGQESIVDLLLQSGADVNLTTGSGLTALTLAEQSGHAGIAAKLRARGATGQAPTAVPDDDPRTAVLMAVYSGDMNALQALISQGVNVNNYTYRDGLTPLMVAATSGHTQIVAELIRRGANVNHQAETGFTALEMARQNNHGEVASLLMQSGARATTPPPSASTGNQPATSGAVSSVNAPRELLFAAFSGDNSAVQRLIAGGLDPNFVKQDDGTTPLMLAALGGHTEVVRTLLGHRVNLNAKNQQGRTALQLATQNGHNAIAKLLRDAGAQDQ